MKAKSWFYKKWYKWKKVSLIKMDVELENMGPKPNLNDFLSTKST